MTLEKAKRLGLVWSNYMNAGGIDKNMIVFFMFLDKSPEPIVLVWSVRIKYLEIAHIEKVRVDVAQWDNMYVTNHTQKMTKNESKIIARTFEANKKSLIKTLFRKTPISRGIYIDQFI